ncbi:hypothetical protein O3M35_012530 [Rhynocoris fuscipes]|uniref:Uncharacterized protein n=1 Tax=Rhynocoris fuscipes TaxID=488301 RepID=A0AAW1CUB3_9HEMI
MIVEAKPLHKKKKRLAKQRSLKGSIGNDTPAQLSDFRPYNREKELARREMEHKENEWEQELLEAMNASTNLPPVSTAKSKSLLTPAVTQDRRRSSCKITISSKSVQTRLAATTPTSKTNTDGSSTCFPNQISPYGSDSVFLPSNSIDSHSSRPNSSSPPPLSTPAAPIIKIPSIQVYDDNKS